MSNAQTPTAGNEQAEKPKGRARRVISERSAARRVRVVEQLKNPIVVAEDVDQLTDQANDIYLAFKPRNAWQDWLTSEIAIIMVRINRCARIERRLRDMASYRAIDFWEDDQKLEVETLALKIDRQPGRVVSKLRQTPAGCEWLLTRWRLLAKIAVREWTDEQRTLAGSLVGGDPVIDPTAAGFAAEQVRELEVRRHRVEEADEIVRGLVEADLSDSGVPGLASLRRYSRSLHRQMKYYIDQFHVEHPDRWDDPSRKPAFIAHEFADRERERKSSWSFAKPEPRIVETKPFAADQAEAQFESEHEIDKTKPLSSDSKQEIDETKPTGRRGLVGTLAKTVAEVINGEEVMGCHDYSNEKIKVVDRPRRVDPIRDANQRRKMALRREALASLSGV